jgi:excisionase family DNA binding protein
MGVSRATAYRLIHRGELPAVKVGAQLRVDPLELETYIYGDAPEVFTVDDLARRLGRDPAWIHRQAMRGLPCVWDGRGELVSVTREQLPAWVAWSEAT